MKCIDALTRVVCGGLPEGEWKGLAEETEGAMGGLFGQGNRFDSRTGWARRVSFMPGADQVPFAGFVHEDSPDSGMYGGMSFIWFPVAPDGEAPAGALLTLVCGTRGLSPDEHILGRPGHARRLQALRRHLARRHGIALWVKQDPTNLTEAMPKVMAETFARFPKVLNRYGAHIYAAVALSPATPHADAAVAGLLDFYAMERGWSPLKGAQPDVDALNAALQAETFSHVSEERVHALLESRRFVILQGPPGTGKSRMAARLLRDAFQGHGMSVQFHPAVTYETFVAGITPDVAGADLRFQMRDGWLVKAVRVAESAPEVPFLLHVDEINRADLGRVLGEAIYLFEAQDIARGEGRTVHLPHVLENGAATLSLPDNLYLLGTMNSADRSIAILDLAVRRRFAFVDVWPDAGVVDAQALEPATEAFHRLQDIFVQFAPDDALVLLPGHAYFFASDTMEFATRMRYELIPLLDEYLQEGRLGPCESELRAYVGWLEGMLTQYEAAS